MLGRFSPLLRTQLLVKYSDIPKLFHFVCVVFVLLFIFSWEFRLSLKVDVVAFIFPFFSSSWLTANLCFEKNFFIGLSHASIPYIYIYDWDEKSIEARIHIGSHISWTLNWIDKVSLLTMVFTVATFYWLQFVVSRASCSYEWIVKWAYASPEVKVKELKKKNEKKINNTKLLSALKIQCARLTHDL